MRCEQSVEVVLGVVEFEMLSLTTAGAAVLALVAVVAVVWRGPVCA